MSGYTKVCTKFKGGIQLKCEKCGFEMKEINRENRMVEMDDDATEGQMADYIAAELSGDYEEWGVIEITYKCERCGEILIEEVY